MKIVNYLVIILAVTLLLSGCDITGKAASDFGTLEVTSEPDAMFYVNGDYRGESPESTALSPGTYTIKISKPNYYDYETSVTIKAEEIVKVEAKLQPLREIEEMSFGKFTITTEPEGATVLIDEEEMGKTPLTLEKVVLGDHMVRIFKTGYYDHSTDKNIISGPNLLSVELKELGTKPYIANGILNVESDPTESFIFVDGLYKDKSPKNVELLEGEHTIRVSRGGFKDHVENVIIVKGQTKTLSVTLEKTGLSS